MCQTTFLIMSHQLPLMPNYGGAPDENITMGYEEDSCHEVTPMVPTITYLYDQCPQDNRKLQKP